MSGMAAADGVTRPEKLSEVEQLWRYEEERKLRRQRFNRVARKIVALVMVLALALLSYDAGLAALALRRDKPLDVPPGNLTYIANVHGSWIYPATVSGVSALAALLIMAVALLRRRRQGSHRG